MQKININTNWPYGEPHLLEFIRIDGKKESIKYDYFIDLIRSKTIKYKCRYGKDPKYIIMNEMFENLIGKFITINGIEVIFSPAVRYIKII